MEQLETLIRLHRLDLDEKRKALAAREEVRARLMAEKDRLLAEMAEEKKLQAKTLEGELSRGSYIKVTLRKVEQLDQLIAAAEDEVEKARTALQEVYEEVKRYEIARDIRDEAAAKDAARRETKDLDEVGGETKRRQAEEN